MKLFGFLRKPDWQHKDASVRLRAAQHGDDAGLLAQLPAMAQADPEPRVRAAALRRMDDPNLLARRMRGELDASVAAVARERLVQVLCDAAVDFDARRAAMLDLPDPEVLARVAERGPEAALRRAALEHVSRTGLLVERCLRDPDPAIRAWLLSRIDEPDVLQRIAQSARRQDKTLARAARERQQALLLAAGDRVALGEAASSLADRAGRLARELPEDREARLAALRGEWQSIAGRVDDAQQRRTEGALDMAEVAITASRAAAVVPAAAPASEDTGAAAGDDPIADGRGRPSGDGSGDASAIAAEVDADAHADADADADASANLQPAAVGDGAVSQTDAAAAAAASAATERKAERTRQATEALRALAAALEADHIGEARAARQQLDPAALGPAGRRELAALEQRLAKLEEWQRWAGNSVRRRLCDEVQALQGSGLHPDALATRVKDLQAEWARLDASEGQAAPPADSGIARRFRGLCHAALKPARGYFEKRRDLREAQSAGIDALLSEVAPALEAGQPPAWMALRRRIAAALRELDGVPPPQRGGHGRSLRSALEQIDARLASAREEAALDKRRLIARLRRDLGSADADAAAALGRQAQEDWKRLPRAGRAEEEALWQELRGVVDPVFAGMAERDSARRRQAAEADAAARAVLDELEALASADAARLAHAQAHLDTLAGRWRALTPADPAEDAPAPRNTRGAPRDRRPARAPRPARHPLESAYEAAVGRVQQAQRALLQERQREERQAIAAAARLHDALLGGKEAGERERLQQQIQALPVGADVHAALQQAQEASGQGAMPDEASAAAQALAVRAELIAGTESPASDAALRRQEQMQRLAARLEGRTAEDAGTQLRALALQLLSTPLAGDARARLVERVVAAWEQQARGS